jgi:hypothetical protein
MPSAKGERIQTSNCLFLGYRVVGFMSIIVSFDFRFQMEHTCNSTKIKSDTTFGIALGSPEQNRTAIKCLGNIYSIR